VKKPHRWNKKVIRRTNGILLEVVTGKMEWMIYLSIRVVIVLLGNKSPNTGCMVLPGLLCGFFVPD